MAVTEIRHVLVDGAGTPRYGVLVTADPLPPAGLLLGDAGEVTDGVETLSGTGGLVSLMLTPSSEYVDSALYEIRWRGHRKVITVPDGGPFDLFDVLVPSLGGSPEPASSTFGSGPFGSGPFGGAP